MTDAYISYRKESYFVRNERRLLPISVQSFEKLRNNNCVYVDKTEFGIIAK